MEKQLRNCLSEFYSRLEYTYTEWKNLRKLAEQSIIVMKHVIVLLRHKESGQNAELLKVEGLEDKLLQKFFILFEEELQRIKNINDSMKSLCQGLKSSLVCIEKTKDNISLKDEEIEEIIKGTTLSFDMLFKWAEESTTYYNDLDSDVCEKKDRFNYVENIIEALEQAFAAEEANRNGITRILMAKKFLDRKNNR